MENNVNIISNEDLIKIIKQHPDNFTNIFSSKKYSHLYKNTFDYINKKYDGKKFTEKLYKHIYGEKFCKECNKKLNSNQFRSFFDGYKKQLCSKKCSYNSNERNLKIKETKLKKYGNSNYNNLKKQKNTMKKLYGVEHNWNRNSPMRESCYITNLKKNGNRTWNNPEKSKTTKIKNNSYKKQILNSKNTCLKKYGVEFVSQVEEFKEKIKQTNIKKYGVEYPAQNSLICDKSYKKWKKFVFPSGKTINVQGYEPIALKILLENINENDLITKKSDLPEIWYKFENKKSRYFPDIYIKSLNKFIEVKSDYTYKFQEKRNIEKHNICLSLGFLHEIWIFDKYENLKTIITDYVNK